MSTFTVWGCVFGGIYLVWMFFVVYFGTRDASRPAKKQKRADRFDERQIAAQGQAYRWGFFTVMGWSLLYVLADSISDITWCHPYVVQFAGVFLGLTVFAVLCVLKDAYVARNQSRTTALIVLNINLLSMGSIGLNGENPLIENGVLDSGVVYLLFVLSVLVIDAAFLIRRRKEKHAEKEMQDA